MKKRTAAFISVILIILSFSVTAYAEEPRVSARSAVLMCVNSGEVIYEKNADERLSMASTTKIMTSLLALEYESPDTEITVTEEMVSVEGTSMGLLAGDSVSLRELVYGMLLQSGNDAANAVAVFLGGSVEGFAQLMNERGSEIGMKNTNFVTPSGLDSENHYSTAYDMALLACESMKNPGFASVCSLKKATLTYGNPPYPRTLINHNRLLRMYNGAIGIKTGFTKKSGRCLVSAAQRNGVMLVAVTLKAPDDWNDHIAMFEYGFSKCRGVEVSCCTDDLTVSVAGGDKVRIPVELSGNPVWVEDKECKVRILLEPMVYAPVKKGDKVGSAIFFSGDTVISETDLLAGDSVAFRKCTTQEDDDKNFFSGLIEKIRNLFRGEIIGR